MKKINFLFAIHCHQPVGNFENVIEEAYQKSYLPFIEVLEKFPSIKVTVHYTGILLSWFKEKHPEFLEKIKALSDKGQIEIMTGGYYEPILSVIPEKDRLSQIRKQTEFTEKYLGHKPKGLWLAERIWEPGLVKDLYSAGVEYTALDDYHFISAGFEESALDGYFVTEDQGYTLKVFPISKRLRYLIPFKLPHETIDHLKWLATESGDRAAVLADDGEKFGSWPGTFKWVYEEKWLENFFRTLEQESDWLKTMTFSEYIGNYAAKGRIYIPAASYFEMMEWSLLVSAGKKFDQITTELKHSGRFDQYQQFFKGGFWRNFFVKYPESNNMHKKMLLVSRKLCSIENNFALNTEKITDELLQGQCNCAYWHGVFGGLYLNYLRHAVYEHLIRAENMADEVIHQGGRWIEAEIEDFDKDGEDEIIVSTQLLNLYFDPDKGGSLVELDFRPKCFNLINTLTRREEVYHKEILKPELHQLTLTGTTNGAASIHDMIRVKEVNLQDHLNYDWYRRSCFIEHFLAEGTTFESFSKCKYKELGDFVGQPYRGEVSYGKSEVAVILTRDGHVGGNGDRLPVRVSKTFRISSDNAEMEIKWEIRNLSDRQTDIWFGVECNLSLLAGSAADRYYMVDGKKPEDPNLSSSGESSNIYEVDLIDKWSGISIIIDASRRFDLWRFPIETVSQSEGGFERTFQGSCMLLNFRLSLAARGTQEFSVKFKIKGGAN